MCAGLVEDDDVELALRPEGLVAAEERVARHVERGVRVFGQDFRAVGPLDGDGLSRCGVNFSASATSCGRATTAHDEGTTARGGEKGEGLRVFPSPMSSARMPPSPREARPCIQARPSRW